MEQLPAIPVRRAELEPRVATAHPGLTLDEVRQALGGREITSRREHGHVLRIWRFEIVDAAAPPDRYVLVRGDFEGGRLVEMIYLPQG